MYSSLFNLMDAEELRFILGHEMGHVSLGHTWLNSVLGGMAGIPTSFGASMLLNASFLWWNRACEYSADRAGLLACGNPVKAVSALAKLATGSQMQTQSDLAQALRLLEAQDDSMLNRIQEILCTHPMIVRRIQALRRYAASAQYKRLQARVNQNPVNRMDSGLRRCNTPVPAISIAPGIARLGIQGKVIQGQPIIRHLQAAIGARRRSKGALDIRRAEDRGCFR